MRRKRKKNVAVNIVFDRNHTATKSHAKDKRKGSVVISVYYDGRYVFIPTGVRVYSDQFKNGRVYNHGQQAQYNERISLTLTAVNDYINNVYKKGVTFNVDMLRDYMSDAYLGNDNSFLDFMEKSIEERNNSESTKNKHRQIYRRLKDWGHIRSFKDITVENVRAWHQEAVRVAIKSAFTVNYDRVLRIYVRMAVQKDLVKENPYKKWKVPKYVPAQTHRSITLEDLRLIENVPLTKKFEIISRDLFVFQANTGMAYVDTQNFDLDELRRNKGWIAYQNNRVKTFEHFYIPLNDKAKAILKKYDGLPPKIGLEAYNVNLKRVARQAGVTLPISSHWARHTFAMICVNNGMSIFTLSKLLGHSNVATTEIYAQLSQKTIDDEFDKVMDNIKE